MEKNSYREVIISYLSQTKRPVTTNELSVYISSIGLNPATLRSTLRNMLNSNESEIEKCAFGVYQLKENFDDKITWAAFSLRNPKAIFCLLSAANYHNITQDMGTRTMIAIPRIIGKVSTESSFYSAEILSWSDKRSLTVGIDKIKINNVDVLITSPERTVIDMFRYSPFGSIRGRKNSEPLIDIETFMDCFYKFMSNERTHESKEKLKNIAEVFNIKDEIIKEMQKVNFTISSGFKI